MRTAPVFAFAFIVLGCFCGVACRYDYSALGARAPDAASPRDDGSDPTSPGSGGAVALVNADGGLGGVGFPLPVSEGGGGNRELGGVGGRAAGGRSGDGGDGEGGARTVGNPRTGGAGGAATDVGNGGRGGAGNRGGRGRGGSDVGGEAGTAGFTAGPGGAGGISASRGGATSTGGGGGNGGSIGSGTGGTAGVGGGGISGPRILSIDFVGGTTIDSLSAAASGRGGGGGVTAAGAATGGVDGSALVSLPAMSAREIAGLVPASHWNSAPGMSGSLAALSLADGTATNAAVTWFSPQSATERGIWWQDYLDAPGDVRMMNGYLDPHSALFPDTPATIVVNGLPGSMTSAGYDVYVYASGEVPTLTRTYHYAIGKMTFAVAQTGPSPTTFNGYAPLSMDGGEANVVVFRNLSDSFFTLIATPGDGGRCPVNGLQIVSPPSGP